jgi:hypothetical protein
MITVKLKEKDIIKAANEGMDAFVGAFVDKINEAIGGELTGETMQLLNADQITLLAYVQMRDEVMDGGFVQLIHNGYGPFLFKNPFAKALKMWGLTDLSKLVYSAATLYNKHHEAIEADCSDAEFMSLFERFPDFDDLDDEFVENEEMWTARIAEYIDEHIEAFATVEK